MKLFNVKEIIEYAIKIEKESFAFYTKASKFVRDSDVKKLVELLADEEIDHQNRLRKLIGEQKISKAKMDKKHEIDTTLMERLVSTAEITTDSSTMDVLAVALEREQNTQQTYRMLATLSNIEDDVIEIFDELALQEKGHANKIQFRIDHLGT